MKVGSKKSTRISDKLLPGNVVPHPQAKHLPETKHLHNSPTPTPVLPKAENLPCYQSNTVGPYGLPGEKLRYVGINIPTGTSLRNVDHWSWLKKHPKVSPHTNQHQPTQNTLLVNEDPQSHLQVTPKKHQQQSPINKYTTATLTPRKRDTTRMSPYH